MTSHEYKCECGHEFKRKQGIPALAFWKCPKCGKLARQDTRAPAMNMQIISNRDMQRINALKEND